MLLLETLTNEFDELFLDNFVDDIGEEGFVPPNVVPRNDRARNVRKLVRELLLNDDSSFKKDDEGTADGKFVTFFETLENRSEI
jgi:hypothetical protein